MPNINTKISRAKAKLLVNYPYFGTLAAKLELVVNDDIEAFKSDGRKLQYNSDYIQESGDEEIAFILANGAMHATLAHEKRKLNRSGWLWQMATDMAINDMLVQNGFVLPSEAQYRKRFEGMYAEEIYAELKDDMLREDEGLEYEADDSDDVQREDSKEQIQEEILNEQLFAEEALAQLEKNLQKGEIPKSIERFFTLENKGKINWRDELKHAIDKFYKDDFTLMPPSKKFLYMGIYLPSPSSEKFTLTIAVDSSGSVDEELLNMFLSEINFLMLSMQNYTIELLVCDDKIRSHTTFYSGDKLECTLMGNGATDFRPVFEFIQNKLYDTSLLLYFTDLEGIFPHVPEQSGKYSWCTKPSFDVKWIAPKKKEIPFGELILL